MKNIFFSIIAMATVATITVSCNQSSKKNNEQANNSTAVLETQDLSSSAQSDTAAIVTSRDTVSQKVEKSAKKEQAQNFSIEPIVKDYLALKNALVADNDKAAANAGKQLFATLSKVDMKNVPAKKHKEFMDIFENAKENAEHIGDNAGKIDHQREHLASLSKDVSDLITLFGTTQKLYQDYCPMYNDSKGAVWISEAKAIKNPYYGSKMLSCGSVKKEF
ncbi:DUF3347 domain-containing protein [Epilithonimonas ginsengisoli]|uniref:Protein of uncharacterized function (DUF3347) n=2 Tax=Chryseobacterium group TaxID=2782232 RepID=A0AAX2IFB0_9FLAO|nr:MULTISPECIES: DUF3347 domain-containing protein [Chryseobacterium group]MBV6879126.1 DUF3347 domain-containing protein [Epilithonimonas sp. FP105]MDW8549559.1 DUF3347 domain-containing protein [Epilithonimonas ginsengisoli]OAH74421.1 hypothetical protein AXA65_06590 [Chryseobacterium sp. FP211-J200]SKC06097.1 Protein of unknown function [Chryseobacterium balustinum]SQA86795.1 Protein of uncharacterised function (DUF3347) [Chryseobacterium balustinum]